MSSDVLLPEQRQQQDFFVCDIFDAVPKSDMASMEHPIFSLSQKPDLKIRRYEHNGTWLEVRPSIHGIANIHDSDVLIFCISQVMAAVKRGQKVSKTLRFNAYDLLLATNRGTGGNRYKHLRTALERLQGTQIATNILTGGKETLDIFSLVDSARVVRKTREGRMQEVEITLSDWVFNAIRASEILTLHRNYFRLRKPLERQIYRLARKHCGRQKEWKISLNLLRKKCGSALSSAQFKYAIRSIIKDNDKHHHIPDYHILLDGDIITFAKRKSSNLTEINDIPTIKPETIERGAELIEVSGKNISYQFLREQFTVQLQEGFKPDNIDGAFIGFVRKKLKEQL